MFLCDKCHNNEKCKWAFMHGLSLGKCEGCGEVHGCMDCHNY